jgi:hypothetical protein
LATDLSFETSVIGYSFGINFQPNLFLNNPWNEVIATLKQSNSLFFILWIVCGLSNP